jgi:hypothetical protein
MVGPNNMIWHVIYVGQNGVVQSRAARTIDHALDTAYELHSEQLEVRRIIAPDGSEVAHSVIARRYAKGDPKLAIPPHSEPTTKA